MTLGDRIKRRRMTRGLTQEQLARLAEFPRPRIAELETNRRFTVASDVLKRLALALGCTTDYLVDIYDVECEQMPVDAAPVGA